MSASPDGSPRRRRLAVALALVFGTALIAAIVKWTEPEPARDTAFRRTPMLVEVHAAQAGDHVPQIAALGAVRAAQDVWLQPRVAGPVTWLAPTLVPGAVVQAGEALVRIDPADADNALAQARSARQLAEADLALEQGRQAVARTERNHIEGEISPEQEKLVLREPQLLAARATLDAARAREHQAELELARTRLTAPFRALVLSREVGTGSQVDPGTPVARLVAVDTFWVEVTVPRRVVDVLPDGATAQVRDAAAWADGVSREGRLAGVVRAVDDQTRLARLLVSVDDPLALDHDGPALTVGAFVEVTLAARPLRDVIRLPRAWVRKDDVVWTMVDGVLRLAQVEVALEDAEYAYITGGLEPGTAVVTTDLATVADGAPLRTREPGP